MATPKVPGPKSTEDQWQSKTRQNQAIYRVYITSALQRADNSWCPKSTISLSRFEGLKLATKCNQMQPILHQQTISQPSQHVKAVRPWEDHGQEWFRGSGTEWASARAKAGHFRWGGPARSCKLNSGYTLHELCVQKIGEFRSCSLRLLCAGQTWSNWLSFFQRKQPSVLKLSQLCEGVQRWRFLRWRSLCPWSAKLRDAHLYSSCMFLLICKVLWFVESSPLCGPLQDRQTKVLKVKRVPGILGILGTSRYISVHLLDLCGFMWIRSTSWPSCAAAQHPV